MNIKYIPLDDGTEHFHIDPLHHEDNSQSPGVLLLHTPGRQRGRTFSISSIASCYYYVHRDTLIGDVVEELNRYDTLLAIGMVGDDREALGVISRRELFNLLGRSFGEEAARDMPVSRIARNTGIYREDANTITVSEQIADEMKKPTLRFFLIADTEGKFAGIFSTRDIMTHLAAVTRKDLDTAGIIQSRIVPETSIFEKGRIKAGAMTQMAMGVGGDFYSMKHFPDDKWFFTIADVSGKGMGASLLTSIAGGVLYMYDLSKGLKQLIKKFNSYLFSTFNAEKFITAIFMTLDGNTGRLSIYDMGHSMLYLLRGNRFHNIRAKKNNLPLGIMQEIDPAAVSVKLEPGDILLMVTDGVTEQCDSEREEYGIERCAKIIAKNRNRNPEEIISLMKNDINEFRGNEQQYDDITFMLIKYD
ncbi:MAG TPA: SpoIIE family protein phosphatase [Spirochaetota bacterium]|nr:SpoIIE family protein phosphatase [Spirochaetota bacterium]